MVRTPLAERMVTSLPPGAEQAMLSVVPQVRWCEPDEVAEMVVFLCSNAASQVSGHVIPIDGGWPARSEQLISRHVSFSVALRIADVTSTEYKQKVDMIIYRAILGAFQLARKQIAVPGWVR